MPGRATRYVWGEVGEETHPLRHAPARTVIIATGAWFRRPALATLAQFESAGASSSPPGLRSPWRGRCR